MDPRKASNKYRRHLTAAVLATFLAAAGMPPNAVKGMEWFENKS